jgi:hypothetical protein
VPASRLDLFGFGQVQGVGFFDVANPDGLVRMLDRVRQLRRDRR